MNSTCHSSEAAIQHVDNVPVFDSSSRCGEVALVEKRSGRCRGNANQRIEAHEWDDSAVFGFGYRQVGSGVESDGSKQKDEGSQCHLLYIIDRIYDQILLFLTNRFVATGIECGLIWLQFPFFSNRPVRGPVIKAAAKPADPPMAWTTPLPAKSR